MKVLGHRSVPYVIKFQIQSKHADCFYSSSEEPLFALNEDRGNSVQTVVIQYTMVDLCARH